MEMERDYNEVVREMLIATRDIEAQLTDCKRQMEDKLDAVTSTSEYKELQFKVDDLLIELDELSGAIDKTLLASGEKNLCDRYVWVVNKRKLEYDQQKAMDWAIQHKHDELITVSIRKQDFEKIISSLPALPDFVTETFEQRVSHKTDLSGL